MAAVKAPQILARQNKSQDNINGKGQFNSDDNDYVDNDDGSEEDKLGNDAILTEADIFLSERKNEDHS